MALSEKLKDIEINSTDISWELLRNTITDTCSTELGKQERVHEDWFDENDKEINALFALKRKAFISWHQEYRNRQKREHYHSIRSIVQNKIRGMKNNWWSRKSEELQRLADMNNSKEFFAATRKLYGPRSGGVGPIASKDGSTVHKEKAKIRERWGEHFSELLNQDAQVDEDAIERLPKLPTITELAEPPTIDELEKAITMTKPGKAAGPDGIPSEIFKNGGKYLSDKILELFRLIWERESLHPDLRDANIVTIFKKGSKLDCGNYRGISLLSIAGKLLARIVSYRLCTITEQCLPESQCGFRPNRGTVDMIFAARQIQEKCREQHQDLFMAFIDLKKAFDTVHRPTLWKILSKVGCPDKLINIVRILHDGMKASVLVDGDYTKEFDVRTGVKQGCVIAPTLFSIFLSAVLHLVRERMPAGVKIRYRFDDIFNLSRLKAKTKTSIQTICELQYADDNAIMAHSEEDLQCAMTAFHEAYTSLGLTLNAKKTQVLYQPRPNANSRNVNIRVDEQVLENVESFNYLGSCLSAKANIDAEISRRLQSASAALGKLQSRVFNNKDIYESTKMKVYKAVVLPTLLYGSETWVTYSHNLSSLEKFHDRSVRRIFGISWQSRQTTNSVFERAKTTSIEAMIIKNQLRWSGHVVRMDGGRLPKQIMYAQLENGKRTQGGQRKRYKDTLHQSLKQCFIHPKTWEHQALQRDTWRSSIHKGVEIFEGQRRQKREDKRAARKERERNAGLQSAVTGTEVSCPHCDKTCRSRIGLISHLRTHK